MATDDKTSEAQDQAEEPRTTYKFNGPKKQGSSTSRIIVEGSTMNPVRFADIGGSVDLTEAEHKDLSQTYKFSKVSDESREPASVNEGDNSAPETRAEQQDAQVASGAQHSAVGDKDNTPAAKQQRAGGKN